MTVNAELDLAVELAKAHRKGEAAAARVAA